MNIYHLQSISPSSFLSELTHNKICVIDADTTDSVEIEKAYSHFIQKLGYVIKANENLVSGVVTQNQWTDITFDPTKNNTYRHSNTAQPLHTDYGYFAVEIDTIFIIGIEQAEKGGETQFITGDKVANYLKEKNEELFHFCLNQPLQMGRGNEPYSQNEDTILSQIDGEYKLNWNFYRIKETNPEEVKTQCKKVFELFKELQSNHSLMENITLQPGQAVFFKDRYVLHGRKGFTGNRKLLKGGIVTEDIPEKKAAIERLLNR